MRWVCTNCQRAYSLEHVKDWGRHELSSGQGSQPRCSNLIEAPNAPPAVTRGPDGVQQLQVALQVCGGSLGYDGSTTRTVDPATDVFPIKVR